MERDAQVPRAESNAGEEAQTQSHRTGLIALFLILGIETVLFSTIAAAFLYLHSDKPVWDPQTPAQFRLLFPAVNTLILVASAFVISRAPRAIRRGSRSGLLMSEQIALLLGLLFLTGQIFDFTHSGMAINDPGFGGAFFALIAFHAVHVVAGVFILGLVVARVHLGDFQTGKPTMVDVSAWFWYYVAFVWVVLFILLYVY